MRRLGPERGQTTAEYVGLLVVVAAIIAAISAADIGAQITSKIEEAIAAIATDEGLGESQGGSQPSVSSTPATQPADYRPHLSEARIATGRSFGALTTAPAVALRAERPRSPEPRLAQASAGGLLIKLLKRLFGGGGPKPAPRPAPRPPAKPAPKPAPKINIEDAKAVRGADPVDIRRIARERGYEVFSPAKKGGGGDRFFKPRTNRSEGIRVMRGDPKAPPGIKRGPYAIITKGNKKTRVPLKGNPDL